MLGSLEEGATDSSTKLKHSENQLHALAMQKNYEGSEDDLHKHACDLAMRNDCEVNAKDEGGKSALQVAAGNGNARMVRTLIQLGADVNNRDDSMRTPLHDGAIMSGEARDAIDLLIANGADVNAMDSVGDTPLHLAVSRNNVEIVKLLLEHGAFVNCKDKYQKTPLHLVRWTTNEALEIVDLLVSRGADVNARDHARETPFYLAVCNNNLVIVLVFLQNGALANCKNNFQMTPLHRVLLSKNVSMQMVELLLTNEANPNTNDYKGESPLYLTVWKNNLPIARLLIEHGAFVMCRNKYGQTALHRAVIDESVEMAELLLANGADVNFRDRMGKSPLHNFFNQMTLNDSGERILKMLLDKGANVDPHVLYYPHNTLFFALSIRNEILADKLRNYGGLKVQCLVHPNREVAFHDYNDYLIEIKKIQSTKIGNHKSLFDFLLMHPKRRCTYMKNEMVQQLIESTKLNELFPIYSCIILARYNEAVTRKSLEESAKEALHAMTRFQLPDSVDKILAHLKNEDLINIAQANFCDNADDNE